MSGRSHPTSSPVRRVTISEMIENKVSMLSGDTPTGYSAIETPSEALAAASPHVETVLRVFIVWDNPADNFDLQGALERMRETGAAMVTKVEKVS